MLLFDQNDTIFALGTAPGRAGIAVIRISGDSSTYIAEKLSKMPAPAPRYMSLRPLWSITQPEEIIDRALFVRFEAGSSYTGEESLELQVHGGRATVSRILEELAGIEGLRLASPGEFTRRALMNGVMDLTQVGGLADLIDAQTEMQRKQALALAEGGFSRLIGEWRKRLVSGLAFLEASIEFDEEYDTPDKVMADVIEFITPVFKELDEVIAASRKSRRLKEGFEVALVGPPNVGKSSLLNTLANDECAIVSPVAGTTRDILRVALDIQGLPVTVLDMAGLRETEDEVEKIGVEKAKHVAETADLRIFLRSSDTDASSISLEKEDGDIIVWNKSDTSLGEGDVHISTRSLEGIEELKTAIHQILLTRAPDFSLVAGHHQLGSLKEAYSSLVSATDTDREEVAVELIKLAVRALDGIIKPVGNEDILDDVFSRFCIGK